MGGREVFFISLSPSFNFLYYLLLVLFLLALRFLLANSLLFYFILWLFNSLFLPGNNKILQVGWSFNLISCCYVGLLTSKIIPQLYGAVNLDWKIIFTFLYSFGLFTHFYFRRAEWETGQDFEVIFNSNNFYNHHHLEPIWEELIREKNRNWKSANPFTHSLSWSVNKIKIWSCISAYQ